MCSLVEIVIAMLIGTALLQTQVTRVLLDSISEEKSIAIMRYGDVGVVRSLLEHHKMDTEACILCSRNMSEDMCNSSNTVDRKDLCVDVMKYCRVMCPWVK